MSANIGSTPWVLQAAGLCVGLECTPAGAAEKLVRRYDAFQAPAGTRPQITLRVVLEPADKLSGLMALNSGSWSGRVRLVGDGYQGWLDLEAGRGELEIRSAHALVELDYFMRLTYAHLAFFAGGLLFHAAAIVQDGRGYVFFGPSGSGKTTAAGLSHHGNVLNDDLVILLPENGGWSVHATPFWNPSQVAPHPGQARLTGLYRLVQDTRVYLEPLSAALGAAELVASTPLFASSVTNAPVLLERSRAISSAVPACRLHFRKDPSFWEVVLTAARVGEV